MKHFLLALALIAPYSASALEVSDVKLVRVTSEFNYQCTETWELGKPSYVATLNSAQANDTSASLSFHIQFELCSGSKGNQSWISRRPLDPTYNRDDQGNPVREEYSRPEFVFGSDMGSLDQQVVSVPNDAAQDVAVQLPFSTGLTAEQKAALAAGQSVRVRTELLYRAIGIAYLSDGDFIKLGYQFGVTYTVFFTLKN